MTMHLQVIEEKSAFDQTYMLDENDIFILKKLNLNIQYRPNSGRIRGEFTKGTKVYIMMAINKN